MPIYEYACGACDHGFEMLQPIGAAPPATCPACGASEVRKRVSATSFVLKGGGWYRDGYGLKPGASTSGTTSEKGSAKADSASSPSARAAAK